MTTTTAPAEALIDDFEHEATRMARMVSGAQFSPHLAPVSSDFQRYDAARTALRAALTRAQAAEAERDRLLALVGTWRGHIAWLEDEGDTGERHQAFTECADELEAVLGGKE